MAKPPKPEFETIATNRRALMKYHVEESFEAGLELKGPEVKSIRNRQVSLEGSFARVEREEVFVYNMHVAPYAYNTVEALDPYRTRRLLLKRQEIKRLIGRTTGKKITLVPLEVYLKRGWVKVRLALATGKAGPDRREEIKKRETDREVARELRGRRG